MDSIIRKIQEERMRQDKKWGEQLHPHLFWLGILTEEIGEVAKEIIEGHANDKIETELIQAASVIVAWLEAMEKCDE